ncbi:unnamed protein product, partial [marine sediment metagenome]
AILVSIITLAYYLKVQKLAFFGKLRKKWEGVKEVPFSMKLPMVILSIICLVGGVLLIPSISEVFLEAARDALLAGKEYAALVFGAL